MIGLDKLGSIIKELGKDINYLALVQNTERKRLRDSLLAICDKCENAFAEYLKASEKIRANFDDEAKLIDSIDRFLRDDDLTLRFRASHLCSEISALLDDLKSNLAGLKYSVAFNKIDLLKAELGTMHQFDVDLDTQYYMMRQELQTLCDDFKIEGKKISAELLKNTLNDFRDSLKQLLDSVRVTKFSMEQIM